MQYAVGMVKLKEGLFTKAELTDNRAIRLLDSGWNTEFSGGVEAFFALLHDKTSGIYESRYIALSSLAHSFGEYSYRTEGYKLTLPKLKKAMDNMLFGYYRDQVLVSTAVPVGEVKRDRYTKYYLSGWERFHANRLK
jgi:hypothetical protein